MSLVITTGQTQAGDFSHIILKLILQVLVPVFGGLLLNRFFGHWAQKNARFLKLFDQATILLIVYLSFAESFHQKLFANTKLLHLSLVILLTTALFFLIYGIISLLSKKLKFNREDRITALFAGSKKSLVHGTVMAGILFQGVTGVGVILLPLMIYHALQLIYTGLIAQRLSRTSS